MRPGRAARPLAAKLIADGFDVVSLSRRPAESPHLVPGAVAHLAFDPADAGPWQDAIDGARAVVALGGAPFFRKWASWEEFERVGTGGRVVANRALVSAIERASRRPEVYVTASAVGYYGFIDSDEIITESSPAGPADRCTISWGGLRVSLTSLLWVKSLVVEAFSLYPCPSCRARPADGWCCRSPMLGSDFVARDVPGPGARSGESPQGATWGVTQGDECNETANHQPLPCRAVYPSSATPRRSAGSAHVSRKGNPPRTAPPVTADAHVADPAAAHIGSSPGAPPDPPTPPE